MEIDITSLAEMDCFNLSHSRAEGGQDAGTNTWKASKEQAAETPLLDTPEKLQAMREFALDSGGWDESEVNAWSDQEVNALFLQWIAGDVRQLPAKLDDVRFFVKSSGNVYVREDGEMFGPYASHAEAYEAHDPSERGYSTADSLDQIHWPMSEEMQREGTAPGNLFRGDDGRIYFYLGY